MYKILQANFHSRFVASLLILISLLAFSSALESFPQFILDFVVMIFHEFGHALAAIMTGSLAIPFFFVTFSAPRNIPGLSLLVGIDLILVLLLHMNSLKGCSKVLLTFTILQISFFSFLTTPKVDELIVLGGMGGELFIPAILILIFILVRPKLERAKYWYLVIPFAVYSITSRLLIWIQSRIDHSKIPYARDGQGILLFQDPFQAGKVPQGDLEKLIKLYGWSEAKLVQLYLTLAIVCYLLVFLNVMVGLLWDSERAG